MKQKLLIGGGIFAAGLLAGLVLPAIAAPADVGDFNWQKISQQPEFRAAVIDVVNSCIADNGIIYCN